MFGKDKEKERRFKVVKTEGALPDMSIIVDKETGVNYLFVANMAENAGGLTPLLNADGTPVITRDFDE